MNNPVPVLHETIEQAYLKRSCVRELKVLAIMARPNDGTVSFLTNLIENAPDQVKYKTKPYKKSLYFKDELNDLELEFHPELSWSPRSSALHSLKLMGLRAWRAKGFVQKLITSKDKLRGSAALTLLRFDPEEAKGKAIERYVQHHIDRLDDPTQAENALRCLTETRDRSPVPIPLLKETFGGIWKLPKVK